MQSIDILNKWLEFCEYNPDKNTFNLLNDEYELHKSNKVIINVVQNYDSTGVLALMYAKRIAECWIKKHEISLYDIITDKYDLSILKDIWVNFNCDEVIHAENKYINVINTIAQQIIKKPIIGDINNQQLKDDFFNGIQTVVENIDHLHVDVFKKSNNNIESVDRFNTHIHVFNTLADCLLAIENTNDGLYLCYISQNNTVDGYFSYFLKSCGNIISLNERINETYIGQHNNMRNGRWAEQKQYDLFPYDFMFNFSDYDYKGYAKKYIIDEYKLDFFNLGPQVYNTIILTMILINSKFTGKNTSKYKQLYVNSLLPINIKMAIESNDNASNVVLYNNSDIVLHHKNNNIVLDQNKILSGEYSKEYNHKDGCFFTNYNQILVDKFGQDFKFNSNELFITDKTKILMNNENSDVINSEFVGDEDKFKHQGYFIARKQLAEFIKNKQDNLYNDIGNDVGIDKWWDGVLTKNKKQIYKLIIQSLTTDVNIDVKKYSNAFDTNNNYYTTFKVVEQYLDVNYPKNVWVKHILNKDKNWTKIYCDVTGTQCNQWFVFRIYNFNHIKDFLTKTDIETIPDVLYGWINDKYVPYKGNHILNVIDYVEELKTPMNKSSLFKINKYPYSFDFMVGFSKRGLNKIVKEYSNND